MTVKNPAPPELLALREELAAMGLAAGTDFYITDVPIAGFLSSEVVGLSYNIKYAHQYEVWYRDMGESRTLLVTADFSHAKARFVDEAVELAGGRGRGPKAMPGVNPEVPLNELIGRAWKDKHGDKLPGQQ